MLKAVYDPDLEDLMERLGLLGRFNAGSLHCSSCKDQITRDNLHAFFAHGGQIKVSCSRPECIRILLDRFAPPLLGEE